MNRNRPGFPNKNTKKVKFSPKCDPASLWPESYELLKEILIKNEFNRCKRALENNETTPLHFAICHGCDYETVEKIIQFGADIFALDSSGLRPFQVAIQRGDTSIAELLLNSGVQVNYPSRYHYTKGKTLLHEAVQCGRDNIVELLLSRGASVDSVCEFKEKLNYTPLHFAAECGNAKIIELLLDKNADINAKAGAILISPVFLAAVRNKIDAMETLIIKGASLAISPTKPSMNLLHDIILYCRPETLQVLIDGGFPLDTVDYHGNTLLHLAVGINNLKTVHTLLTSGANVNALNGSGETALHCIPCSQESSVLAVSKLLIDAGIDINIPAKNGQTALSRAIVEEIPYLTIILIENNGALLFDEDTIEDIKCVFDMYEECRITLCTYQIVKRHLIALSVSGTNNSTWDSCISDLVSELFDVDQDTKLKAFKESCEKEILSLKETKVTQNSYIDFYKILMGNVEDIHICLKNEEILKELTNSENILKCFPIYGFKINKIVESAKERLSFMNSGIASFMSLFESSPLPLPCVEAILGHLSNDDLRVLSGIPPRIKSLPPLDFYSKGTPSLHNFEGTRYLVPLTAYLRLYDDSESDDSDWGDNDSEFSLSPSDLSIIDFIMDAVLFF